MTETTRLVEADTMAKAVRVGLTAEPKWLPSKYLYDELGSQLFEAICFLPEYYLTRAERSILEGHAGDIVARLDEAARLVELGAGSAVKTRLLIGALLARGGDLTYCPIDISEEAMRIAQANITSEFPAVRFKGVIGDWVGSLGRLTAMDDHQKLILFLGSSIGNLTSEEAAGFLGSLHDAMGPRDKLLLGTDLVKSTDILVPAYDDAAGVTAAFNKNILVRINQELGGHFDTRLFDHEARWNDTLHRMEMHLVAKEAHAVSIDSLPMTVRFEKGESIHTENSHKYTQEAVDSMTAGVGLRVEKTWTDDEGGFALHLVGRA